MTSNDEKFCQVLAYVEANLDNNLEKNLNIDSLSKVACLSKYHFHRQFSAAFGINLYAVIKLLRMKRAAYQLVYRKNIKVLDIALMNGYQSHEAFSRAFGQVFGQTPTGFRKAPQWALWQQQFDPIVQLRKNLGQKMTQNKSPYSVAIVDFPEIHLAVLEHRGSPQQLGQSIQKFIEWRRANRLPPNKSRTFNLVYDDIKTTAPEDYRFDLCCEYKGALVDNDFGMVSKVIPQGKCAMIRHVGSDDLLAPIVKYMYQTWLIEAALNTADFPMFFERVSFFPEVKENEMITDIYLPIAQSERKSEAEND